MMNQAVYFCVCGRPMLRFVHYLVLRRAVRPLLGVGVVLGSEAVHELVDEVEHAHAQRDPLLLAALQRYEQRVEAVGVLVSPC